MMKEDSGTSPDTANGAITTGDRRPSPEVEPLSFFGFLLLLFCLLPWAWGLVAGLLVSPFINGFKVGRAAAGDIGRDAFGEPPDDP